MSLAAVDIPFAIGYTFCFGLTGSLVVQAYTYFTRFAGDRKAIRILVTIVLSLESLITLAIFIWFCIGADRDQLTGLGLIFCGIGPMTGLVTTLTHGLYCWRIASLRKSCWIPTLVMMVSLLQLGSIIYLAITNELFPSTGNSMLSPCLVTWLGGSATCDIMITICMIIYLRPSQCHFEENKSMLVRLTRLTLETGLATAIAALLELVIGVVFYRSWYHIAIFFAISKLYANCLLATLNFRLVLKNRSDPEVKFIVWSDGSDMRGTPSFGPRHVTGPAQTEPDVEITMSEVYSYTET